MSLIEEKRPVEALSAPTSAIQRSAWAFALGAMSGVGITRAPFDLNTASALDANFLSRSWITTLNLMPSSSSFQLRLRACWVTQAWVGRGCSLPPQPGASPDAHI